MTEVDEVSRRGVGDLYVTLAARNLVEEIRKLTREHRERAVDAFVAGQTPLLDRIAVLIDEITMEEERAWRDGFPEG